MGEDDDKLPPPDDEDGGEGAEAPGVEDDVEEPVGRGNGPGSFRTRIKPGEVRNPKGRPTGAKGVLAALKKAMMGKVAWTENGKRETGTLLEAMFSAGMKHAIKGDARFFELAIRMMQIALAMEQGIEIREENHNRHEYLCDLIRLYKIHEHDLMNMDPEHFADLVEKVKAERKPSTMPSSGTLILGMLGKDKDKNKK
jgi:hypothetical protein